NIETYLRTTPKSTLVAGLNAEIDSVPAFSARSVLASLKLLAPLKKIYYYQMATRMTSLAKALYATDGSAFATLVAHYGIDYLLLERLPSDQVVSLSEWAVNFPAVLDTLRALKQGQTPFFVARLDRCVRAEDDNLVLADARCLAASH